MARVLLFGAVWMAILGTFATLYLLPGRPAVKEVQTTSVRRRRTPATPTRVGPSPAPTPRTTR